MVPTLPAGDAPVQLPWVFVSRVIEAAEVLLVDTVCWHEHSPQDPSLPPTLHHVSLSTFGQSLNMWTRRARRFAEKWMSHGASSQHWYPKRRSAPASEWLWRPTWPILSPSGCFCSCAGYREVCGLKGRGPFTGNTHQARIKQELAILEGAVGTEVHGCWWYFIKAYFYIDTTYKPKSHHHTHIWLGPRLWSWFLIKVGSQNTTWGQSCWIVNEKSFSQLK